MIYFWYQIDIVSIRYISDIIALPSTIHHRPIDRRQSIIDRSTVDNPSSTDRPSTPPIYSPSRYANPVPIGRGVWWHREQKNRNRSESTQRTFDDILVVRPSESILRRVRGLRIESFYRGVYIPPHSGEKYFPKNISILYRRACRSVDTYLY